MHTKFKVALALAALATGSSCISQLQYQKSVDLAKSYQTQLHDREQELALLEEEYDRLRAQMRSGQPGTVDAGFAESLQDRMSALQARLENLGRPPGDIERFDVEGGYVLMIQDKVLFQSGSADVEDEGRAALEALARDIQTQPHGLVLVRGHTDADPVSRPETLRRFPHGNLQLSAERAVSVAEVLISGGVSPRDVRIEGYGQWEPVGANDNADTKRLNRRVEVFVADV